MNKDQMAEHMRMVFSNCDRLREKAHKEYAGGDDSFGNFNRLASMLGVDRKHVLMVYATKHFDGIFSFIHGHKSQREDVRGRIEDEIVYLTLLHGMITEEESQEYIERNIEK